jgi:hypothetical protein
LPEFPTAPIPAAEFLENYLPAALAEVGAFEHAAGVDVSLGVLLDGEGGGEWVLDVRAGDVRVRPSPRADAAFTYVQSVDDWRGALWGRRGGAVGQGAAALFRPATRQVEAAATLIAGRIPSTLEALSPLRGLLRLVVTDPAGDWRVDLKLGPGDIPARPTTEVCVSAADADQMASGRLKPMEAFMAGRIRVGGDMALLLQIQAALMQAAGGL